MAARCVYDKVASRDDVCRVLTLHPGIFEDDVTISLSTVQLIKNQKQIYGALSYTWDNNERSEKIYVTPEGQSSTQSDNPWIPATANLVQALRHLRKRDIAFLLWADGVCINQDDVEERGEQVRIMPQIYRSAAHVWIWLGVERDDSSYAVEKLRWWSSKVVFNTTTGEDEMKDPSDTDLWMIDQGAADLEERSLTSFEAIVGRPWFERTWIQQEIRLSGGNATVVCGDSSIPWADFRDAFYAVAGRFHLASGPSLGLWRDRFDLISSLDVPTGQPLEGLLQYVRRTKCSDQRDKVYAVLGMLHEDEAWMAGCLTPDYTLDVETLYKRVSGILLQGRRNLKVLAHCEPDGAASVRPTWVVDWSKPRAAWRELDPYYASAGSDSADCQIDGDTLLVRGTVCDTVHKVQRLALDEASKWALVEDAVRIITYAFLSGTGGIISSEELTPILYAISGGSLTQHAIGTQRHPVHDLNALDRAFRSMQLYIAKRDEFAMNKEHEQASIDYATRSGSPHEAAVKWAWKTSEDANEDITRLAGLAAVSFNNRSLIKTVHGQFGLAPLHTQIADVLVVLLGLGYVVALRLQLDGSYEIVGVCSVHGLNWGEGLLGPLDPLVWRFERHFNESDWGWHPRFRYLPTDEVYSQDPRVDRTESSARDRVMRRIAFESGQFTDEVSPAEYEYFRRHGKPLQTIAIK